MDIICCRCGKEYNLENNIFKCNKANCPILICPHCQFKHIINFMPFEKRIEVKKVKKLDLTVLYVNLGASRIANASRVDQSGVDDGDLYDGIPWDLSTFRYDSKNYKEFEDITPAKVAFNPDGTKMYILGRYHGFVYQYTLSTAWDVSTATYAEKSKNVGDKEGIPYGLAISSDGTKMYIVGSTNDTVYQYTLSTAWDVSTATYAEKSKNVSAQEIVPLNVVFNSDGNKMYILGNANDTVYQYTLTTAWDVSSAIYAEKSGYVGAQEGTPYGLAFSSDGFKMYIVGIVNDTIYQYTLITAWDVSTATYAEKSLYIETEDISPYGLAFNPDGSKMYVVGNANNTIFQYAIPKAWTKTNDFILATRIYGAKGPYSRAYKLRWRKVGETFADVGTTGAITYSATTDLTDDGDLLIGEKLCDAQPGDKPVYVWQNGLESEGDNILPDSGTFSLADDSYTELQWALSCDDAEDEATYEFELWDVTEGASIGACLATVTMTILIIGLSMKWNEVAISKWNGVVINKLNGVD